MKEFLMIKRDFLQSESLTFFAKGFMVKFIGSNKDIFKQEEIINSLSYEDVKSLLLEISNYLEVTNEISQDE